MYYVIAVVFLIIAYYEFKNIKNKWMFNNTTARTQEDTVIGKVVTDNMD